MLTPKQTILLLVAFFIFNAGTVRYFDSRNEIFAKEFARATTELKAQHNQELRFYKDIIESKRQKRKKQGK